MKEIILMIKYILLGAELEFCTDELSGDLHMTAFNEDKYFGMVCYCLLHIFLCNFLSPYHVHLSSYLSVEFVIHYYKQLVHQMHVSYLM